MEVKRLTRMFDKKVVDDSFKIIDRVCKKYPTYTTKWKMQRALFEYAQLTKKRLYRMFPDFCSSGADNSCLSSIPSGLLGKTKVSSPNPLGK